MSVNSGGETEIRTQERVAPLPVFKTGAFNRSAISPEYSYLGTISKHLTSACISVKPAALHSAYNFFLAPTTSSGATFILCILFDFALGFMPRYLVLCLLLLLRSFTQFIFLCCRRQDSNSGPTDYKSVALPTELRRR